MSRPPSVRAALEARRAAGGRALIPFLTAGYPDWDRFDAAVAVLAGEGADALELGLPFSDPLADGPTIQASSERALEAGVTVEGVLAHMRARGAGGLPVVVMTYANPVLAYGAEAFARDAVDAGISGLLVSDLPPEELPEVWAAVRSAGLERVMLVAPTTPPERVARLAEAADGFVYCLTRTGVTGRGGAYAQNLAAQVAQVQACSSLPVVAGFGIRSPEDVAALPASVDGVVVGARWIELLGADGPAAASLASVRELARGLRRALDAPPASARRSV